MLLKEVYSRYDVNNKSIGISFLEVSRKVITGNQRQQHTWWFLARWTPVLAYCWSSWLERQCDAPQHAQHHGSVHGHKSTREAGWTECIWTQRRIILASLKHHTQAHRHSCNISWTTPWLDLSWLIPALVWVHGSLIVVMTRSVPSWLTQPATHDDGDSNGCWL